LSDNVAAESSWHLPRQVFWRFLLLGCVSFGGPAAHIGYFRQAFVERWQWLSETEFARLVALCQFLPGPGSSQLGFAIGYQRAGLGGALAAFVGFSLPSVLLMVALAVYGAAAPEGVLAGVVRGLKLLAVVVVTDAVVTMYRSYCQHRISAGIALASAAVLLAFAGAWSQYLVLVLGALTGLWLLRDASVDRAVTGGRGQSQWWPLLIFAALFLLLPLLASRSPLLELFNDFYRAGSLVFGGGHVVLPLLQQTLGGSLSADTFLLGYASAQAVPGPMFSLSAFLGAELLVENPTVGAVLAVVGIFLPGFLLLLGLQQQWQALAGRPAVAGAVAGINAAVVGLLGSALYHPVFVSAVHAPRDVALVVLGLLALRVLRLPVAWLVAAYALLGAVYLGGL
jgi:chromate transporter